MKKKNKKKKEANKIYLLLFAIVLLILVGYKVIFGTKYINANKNYDKNRYYRLMVNNNEIGIEVEEIKKIPIIPSILYIVYPSNIIYGALDSDELTYEYKLGGQMLFDLWIYECFDKEEQIACDKKSENLIEIIDNSYILSIVRSYKNEKNEEVEDVLYNGNLIKDVSQYFPIKGLYAVNIKRSKGFISTNIIINISII